MSKLVIDTLDLAMIISCDRCPAKNCDGGKVLGDCEEEILKLKCVRLFTHAEQNADRYKNALEKIAARKDYITPPSMGSEKASSPKLLGANDMMSIAIDALTEEKKS